MEVSCSVELFFLYSTVNSLGILSRIRIKTSGSPRHFFGFLARTRLRVRRYCVTIGRKKATFLDSQRMSSDTSGIFSYLEQEKIKSSRVPHALAIVASTVIILAGVQAASSLLGPMLLALFLAIILLVPLRWLQAHGCPQLLAFLFVLICTIVLFVGITYFVSQSLTNFIGKMPAYKDRFAATYVDIEKQLEKWGFGIDEWRKKILPEQQKVSSETPTPPLQESLPVIADVELTSDDSEFSAFEAETDEDDPSVSPPFDDVPTLSDEARKEFEQQATEMKELPSLIALDPQSVVLWLTRVMVYIRSMLEGGFLVLIFTIFMLFEASYLPAKINRAFGQDGPIRIEHFHRIAEDVRRYLFLKTLANLMSGSAAMFVYYMFGVPAFFFWGIIAFFMYYIPNIGGTLAAVIPGVLILMTHGIPGVLLYAVCLITLECTIAYGIEPKMLGHGLRLSTLVIILSLFFWGFLLGAIGLFLAAPLTVMIKIILQAFPETRWIAVFLDGGRERH